MTVNLYANGTGGVLGDELVTETELYTTGIVHFVHHAGSNSNDGFTRQKPWASLVYALAHVATNDIVVLMDGHTETIAAPQTISLNGVKVVGEGSAAGIPTVSLTSSLSNQAMLTITGTNVTLANIRSPVGGSNSSTGRIAVTGTRSMIRGCYFECGANDTLALLTWSIFARGSRLFNTTFISASTTTPAGPGLYSISPADCEMEAVTFDGGTVGFTSGGYFDPSYIGSGSGPTKLRCQQIRLLNGAGFFTGPDTTGYLGIAERTGAPVITGFSRRLPNGFRQTGDAILADAEFYMSGTPLYVHYGTGDNANNGQDELNPKKTIASALTVATDDNDIIVLLPGHVEPLSAGLTPGNVGLTIVGCGTSNGKPSCRIYGNVEGPLSIISTGEAIYIRNVWISENTVTGTTQTKHVGLSVNYAEVRGCFLSMGYRDRVGVVATASLVTVRDTKFESSGTGATTRPERGMLVDVGATADIDVRGCEFSNGVGGFLTAAFHVGESIARMYAISLTQSFGADVIVNAAVTGLLNPETASGSASVEW